MAVQHIAFDIPEEILLAEKTDAESFSREICRRVARLATGLSPNRTLSATPVRPELTRLHHSLDATVCGFG